MHTIILVYLVTSILTLLFFHADLIAARFVLIFKWGQWRSLLSCAAISFTPILGQLFLGLFVGVFWLMAKDALTKREEFILKK